MIASLRGLLEAHGAFFRAVGAVSILRVAGGGLMLLAQVLLAGWMGAEAFGVYSYAWAWVTILSTVAGVGFGSTSVRFVAMYRADRAPMRIRGVLRFGRLVTIVAGGAVTLVAILAASVLASGTPYAEPLRWALLAIPVLAMFNLEAAQARGFDWMALASAAEQVARPLLLIVIAWWLAVAVVDRPSATPFVAACAIAYLLAALGQHAVLRRRVRRAIGPGRAAFEVRGWMRVAIPMLMHGAAYILLTNTDLVMLGLLLEPAQVGIYTAALRIATLVSFVHAVSSLVAQPTIVALHARRSQLDLQRFVTVATRWIFLASSTIGIALSVLGEPTLTLFGPDFAAGYPVLLILIGAHAVVAGLGPVNTLLVMTGHQDWAALTFGVSVLTNIALNTALVPPFGIVGAAVAVGGNLILTNVVLLILVHRRLGIWPAVVGGPGVTDRWAARG